MSLITCVCTNYYGGCKRLLEEGADPNMKDETGRTVLYLATLDKQVEIIKLLLEFGADPNILSKTPHGNYSPLHISTAYDLYNRIHIDELLLSYNADPNVKNSYGITPLHGASASGYSQLIKLLIKYSANLDLKDNAGYTALHYACIRNRIRSVELLLEAGADLYICDSYGLMAKNLTSNIEIINLIEAYEIPIKEPE